MSRNNCKEKVNENKNMKKSQCFNCEGSFDEEKEFQKHVFSCKGKIQNDTVKKFHCSFCDYQSITNDFLIKHAYLVHDKKTVKCRYCNEKFGFKTQLKQHVGKVHDNKGNQIVHNKKIFGCHSCAEEFRFKKGLKKHVEKVHDKKNNQNQCEKKTQLTQNLKTFICSQCYREYQTEKGRKHHFSLVHSGKWLDEVKEVGVARFSSCIMHILIICKLYLFSVNIHILKAFFKNLLKS